MFNAKFFFLKFAKKTFSMVLFLCLLLFLSSLCISCTSHDSDATLLEDALEFAGDNRGELERVIDHYKDDGEKQEAAKFLIRNMPHYYSYKGWQLDSIKPVLAYIANTPGVNVMTGEQRLKWGTFSYNGLEKVYDCKVITADYLIRNIDHAFKVWKGRPWNRSLGFDDFCELLLPYRIGNEPLSDWRPVYEKYYAHILDSAYHGGDVVEACRVVNGELQRQGVEYNTEFSLPHMEATFLLNNRVGYCRENCDLSVYAMRACGIPVASDFFMVSPDYQHSHQWMVVRDTTGVYIQFGFDDIVPQRGKRLSDGRKKGKVYRMCYGMQDDRKTAVLSRDAVPNAMRAVFVKDVTSGYFGCNRVAVPVETKTDNLYLGVFTTKGWQPVDFGEREGSDAVFHDLEPGVIYQTLAYDDNGICQPAGYPFLYPARGGKPQVLKPGEMQKVSLRRKMSLVERVGRRLYRSIIGTRIEASADRTFRHSCLIHEFCDTLRYCNLKIHNNGDGKKYRYLRYTVTDGYPINFSDIAVYEDSLCRKEVPVRLVTKIGNRYEPQNMTDHDMMTAFSGPEGLRSIVFELSRPSRIGSIDFYPQNDANFILPGDTYELFCQDGINGWRSLGTRTATGETVNFMAPKNALLWLRDITRGKEEQVFVYRDGRQLFVYDIR